MTYLSAEKNDWKTFLGLLGLLMIVAAMLLSPLGNNLIIPNVADMTNHFAAIQAAAKAISQGQFPIRVMPDQIQSLQYPFFQFYSSSGYMIASFIYRIFSPSNVFVAYKLTLGLFLVIGGLYFYLLVIWFQISKPIAILSSLIFLCSPYMIIALDHMAAFNESLGLCVMPALLYYSFLCYEHPKGFKTYLLLSLVWYLLASMHGVLFVDASIFVTAVFFIRTLFSRQYWLHFCKLMGAYLFSLLMTAWYFIPAALFHHWMKIEDTFQLINKDYYESSLASLLSPTALFTAGFQMKNYVNTISQMHPAIGLPILLGLGLCLYAILHPIKDLNRIRLDDWLKPLLIVFFINVFVIWSPINIWVFLKLLSLNQYSWRLMNQDIWIGALLSAYALHYLFQGQMKKEGLIIGICLILLSASFWFPLYERSGWSRLINDSIYPLEEDTDVYTIDPNRYPLLSLKQRANQILNVSRVKDHCHSANTHTICQISVPSDVERIALPILYYPKMLSVKMNGKQLPYEPLLQGKYLIASVEARPGSEARIEFGFQGLSLANHLSGWAWGLWILLFFCSLFPRLVGIFDRHSQKI